MRKSLFIFNSKKIPLALIGMMFLVLCLEGFIRFNAVSILPFEYLFVLKKAEVLYDPNLPPPDALIIGDSRVLELNAKRLSAVLSQHKGRDFTVFNFASPYSDIRSYYLLLENYLEHHPQPEVIFFSTMPEAIFVGWNLLGKMDEKEQYIHRLCLLYSLKDFFKVYPAGFVLRHMLYPKLERNFYVLTYRHALKKFAQKGFPFNPYNEERLKISYEDLNGSQQSRPQDSAQPVSEADLIRSGLNQQSASIDPDSVAWLRRFLDLAEQRRIKVVIFNAPIVERFYLSYEQKGLTQRYKAFMAEITQQYENLTVVTPVMESYRKAAFYDPSHLNRSGREIFERALFRKLQAF